MQAHVASLALGLALGGCDRGTGPRAAEGGEATCPPCECVCACEGDTGGTGEGRQGDRTSGELSELVSSASRKMMHGDGRGCLEDLDRIRTLEPNIETQLTLTRAQCQMLIGECQQGKQRVVEWYMREMAFTREFAEKSAENIASMRCRGGDATERDRLLAALFDLSDGAYMNKRDVKFCRDRVALIEKLAPKVTPRDAEDTQVTGGLQALFHTSAMCFARAGDCSTAYAYYRRLFPSEGLAAIQDPQLRESTVRQSFDSTIVLCQQSKP